MVVVTEAINGQNINNGLAHGLTAIFYFFINYYFKTNNLLVLKNIQTLFYFFIEISSPIKNSISLFSNYSLENDYNSRLGWCYGDLGIVNALDKVSRVKPIKYDKDTINYFLNHINNRKGAKQNGIIDNSYCHGLSGVLSYFNLNRKTYNSAFNYWIEKLIYSFNKDTNFYDFYHPKKGYIKTNSLLEGTSGLGLTCLSIMNCKHASFNEFFLWK